MKLTTSLFTIALITTSVQAEFRLYSGLDSYGNDLVELDGATLMECETACARVDACTTFTYNMRHHVCFLKSLPNSNPSVNDDAITGIWQASKTLPKIRIR